MIRRLVLVSLSLALLATIAQAAEIGPEELRGKTVSVRNRATLVRASIARDAASFVKANTVRMRTDRSFAELLCRYVPGCEELGAGKPVDRKRLSAAETGKLQQYSEQLAGSAEQLLAAGLGGAAGLEAYRALGLSPSCRRAGAILKYDLVDGAYQPRRYRAMRSRGMTLTRFGWIPDMLARGERRGYAPERGRWLPIGNVNTAHKDWNTRHVLTYTHVEIQTALSLEEIVEWAPEVDATVGWMRSLFARVPGFEEPSWPLLVKIYRNPREAQANGDSAPKPFAYWRGHGVVNREAFRPGTMQLSRVVQHELAHGLLEHAFPADPRGAVFSGWMTEAFGQWIYHASAERPNDTRFWENMRRIADPVIAEMNRGRDVIGELRKMQYAQGRTSNLAHVAPILADYCFSDPLRWEGFARFMGRYTGYREQYLDFDKLLGPSADVTAALKTWAALRTRPSTGHTPGGGVVTGPAVTRTLTINARFVAGLGIDVAGLAASVGEPTAQQTVLEALVAYTLQRTKSGKPAAGVNVKVDVRPGGREWAITLTGPSNRVEAFVTDLLWQAGIRLPAGTGGAPPPAPPTVIPGVPEKPRSPSNPQPVEPGPRLLDPAQSERAVRSLSRDPTIPKSVIGRVSRGKASAVTALTDLLANGGDRARGMSALILGEVGPVTNGVIPALVRALEDRNGDNRTLVAQAFKQMGPKAKTAVPDLARRLLADTNWVTRQRLASALEKMPEKDLEKVMDSLIKALDDKEPRVRKEVVKVVEKLAKSHPEARVALAVAAQKEKPDVRRLVDDILRGAGGD